MNSQIKEQLDARQANHVGVSLFRRHRFYYLGLLSGVGLGMIVVEAFSHDKNPLIYIGGLWLSLLGSMLYRKFKKDCQR